MPVAGPSRRISRRVEPTQDAIENSSQPSQPQQTQDPLEDASSSDEHQDTSKSKKLTKVKKEKGDPKDPATILANLGNPSLDNAALMKINGIAGDWGLIRESTHKKAVHLIIDVAPSMAEFAEGEESERVRLFFTFPLLDACACGCIDV